MSDSHAVGKKIGIWRDSGSRQAADGWIMRAGSWRQDGACRGDFT